MQSVLPAEVVISDDASSDGTIHIVEGFIGEARRKGIEVTFVRHIRALGITGNFEFAMRRSTRDIILLSDQDDVWTNNKIERILKEFSENDAVLVASDAELIDADGRPMGETLFERLKLTAAERRDLEQGDLTAIGPNRNLFTGATIGIRRSAMLASMPLSRLMHHDDWLGQVSWLFGNCRVIFEPLIQYRLHNNNAVGLSTDSIEPLSPSPRRAHLLWQLSRLEPLCEHILAQSVSAFRRTERASLRLRQHHHVQVRLHMPRAIIRRIRKVGVQWRRGHYNDFHNGWRSAIADIIRPV